MRKRIFAILLLITFIVVISHEIIPHHHENNAAIEYFGEEKYEVEKQSKHNQPREENEEHEQAFPEFFQKSSLHYIVKIISVQNLVYSEIYQSNISKTFLFSYLIKNPEPP